MEDDKAFFLTRKEQLLRSRQKGESVCLFPRCEQPAINSHTFPRSVLRKISEEKDLYVLNLDNFYCSNGSMKHDSYFIPKSPKVLGVERLFCEAHDNKVFSRIEKTGSKVELEVYIYLYGYRLFIYEYYLHHLVNDINITSQTYEDTTFARKMTNNSKERFKSIAFHNTYLLEKVNPFKKSVLLKEKFDEVFKLNDCPDGRELSKNFDFAYFHLDSCPRFLASGIRQFRIKSDKKGEAIPMVFVLLPSPDLKSSIFGIISPKSEQISFTYLKNKLKEYYSSYRKTGSSDFISTILFLLLDASENIIVTESLYNQWVTNGSLDKILKAYHTLSLGDFTPSCREYFRCQVWSYLMNIDYSDWLF